MIAVISDIHGNLHALEAVLSDMPSQVSSLWVLGDSVGELAFPCEVLDRLLALSHAMPVHMVAGNRERDLVAAHEGKCPHWWRGTQYRCLAWTTERLRADHIEWMRRLPSLLLLEDLPGGAALYHGSPAAVRGKIYDAGQAAEACKATPQRWLAGGHTHLSKRFCFGAQTVLGAGSVGLSLDGVGGLANYVLIREHQPPHSPGSVVFRRVCYDLEAAVFAMDKQGFGQQWPGLNRATVLEMRTGRHHVQSLLAFCASYAMQALGKPSLEGEIPPDLWQEAEALWDGAPWIPGRSL